MYENDKRIVLTLDAGGTNFVFSAIKGGVPILPSVRLPAKGDDFEECLKALRKGFDDVISQLQETPVAISFAFPGPADYKNGVIGGNLPNFPSFRSGVALGPYLQHHYGLPVFIENDGNLFAYGEAMFGTLPMINQQLKEAGSPRRYRNLIGVTLGTGFGAGIVINGQLLNGDNGCGGDIWLMRSKDTPCLIAEESVSIRAVKRYYALYSHGSNKDLTPKEIYEIAEGKREGNREAAIKSFAKLGECAGYTLSSVMNIVDGIVVIGGGLIGAEKYILPSLINELRSRVIMNENEEIPCIQPYVYNWNHASEREAFIASSCDSTIIPGTNINVPYESKKQTAIVCSHADTSVSIMQGAYALALSKLDEF